MNLLRLFGLTSLVAGLGIFTVVEKGSAQAFTPEEELDLAVERLVASLDDLEPKPKSLFPALEIVGHHDSAKDNELDSEISEAEDEFGICCVYKVLCGEREVSISVTCPSIDSYDPLWFDDPEERYAKRRAGNLHQLCEDYHSTIGSSPIDRIDFCGLALPPPAEEPQVPINVSF
ncbi:MAG: hypothetical protein K1X79_05630 [Oligoflexia bacterium]|nr:hypothetical protein [Oligoflexia bacterium]